MLGPDDDRGAAPIRGAPSNEGLAMSNDPWRTFNLPDLIEQQAGSGAPYLEFLRVPQLSCGLYRLKAGAKDLQSPHDEDEVYYVVEGRGRLRLGDEDRPVEQGSVLFVRASEDHSFFEIEEDMTLLVFFASGGPETG